MAKSNVKPEKYELGHDYKQLGVNERLNAFVVYREINGYKFFDIVVTINNRVFLMKPWHIYSEKSLNVYNWELHHLAFEMLDKAAK